LRHSEREALSLLKDIAHRRRFSADSLWLPQSLSGIGGSRNGTYGSRDRATPSHLVVSEWFDFRTAMVKKLDRL
jgi:hypothetical protein